MLRAMIRYVKMLAGTMLAALTSRLWRGHGSNDEWAFRSMYFLWAGNSLRDSSQQTGGCVRWQRRSVTTCLRLSRRKTVRRCFGWSAAARHVWQSLHQCCAN